ncbi:AMP-dependent synthetase and ligase [Gautieria morchelliformis]|nr:AMP-dependent synthetase and ligase [Gautieria morchelliformis]
MISPQTLSQLLHVRAADGDSTKGLSYLDDHGSVYKHLSYADLLRDATVHARRLLAAGLTQSDIVVASFHDHESHILLFWACCLAGIRVCPLPPLHPDPTRQAMLFKHLQVLFHGPTLIAPKAVTEGVLKLVPGFKVLPSESLPEATGATSKIFSARSASPNDVVCFMLTSGSTGNSKAVQLTHANLLSGVRGKIHHHGTSSSSRFLSWIAFDHVACVSEIHIHALEANASQWLVAPSAIINNSLNLLEWSSTYRITYTFSPNFLLAHILRDVTNTPFASPLDLSCLRALISGGEAVPMSTAIAFADLISSFGSPRDALRAGFGMSETGAGSIYDRRPIPFKGQRGAPKYLSLGTCAPGIVMRVANPETGRICSPGEPGQLQIKGTTVFSRYYGNEQATMESFADDGWFITGDSAEIDADGNLFLVGRDKDSVNINGVKHPTQDVEHYAEDAKIDGVMHGFVYVCPMRLADADTETYGVFYQHEVVVEAGVTDEQKHAIDAANRAIRRACTIFCSQAPHVILPLPRAAFIKTSLGKVSRSQLTKSYLQGNYGALQAALEVQNGHLSGDGSPTDLLNPIEQVVAEAVASIVTIEESALRRSSNIFDLGASSMHLLRLKHLIQTRLGLTDIPTIDLLRRPEVGELCDYLYELVQENGRGEKDTSYQPVICFNDTGSKPPLFLVHPGVGEVLVFIALARALADDRPVYALRARGFDHNDPTCASFDEMSDTYVEAIEKKYPSGPYYVAGYSFGGAVAFEIGKKLEAKGREVPWFGVFNLPPHIQWRMKELTWFEVLMNLALFLSLVTPSDLNRVRDEIKAEFPVVSAMDVEPPNPQDPVQWLFARSDKVRLAELDLELGAFIRWVKVAYGLNRTGRTFVPQGCIEGALTSIFCAIPLPSMGTREEFKANRLSVWEEFSGERFEMIDVDGEHYTMLSAEHVDSFSKHLRGALRRADEGRKRI